MAKQLQLRKGTATEHNTFTGALGEVTVDTTNKTLRVHDGTTAGGTMLATLSSVVLNNTLTSSSTTQALTAAQGKVLNDQAFGIGQTWQDVTASRALGTTYTNSTGKPIQVSVVVQDNSTVVDLYFFVNGTSVVRMTDLAGGSAGFQQLTITVPSTQTYRLETANLLHSWAELK